jgi:hypothetical protein
MKAGGVRITVKEPEKYMHSVARFWHGYKKAVAQQQYQDTNRV